MDYFKGITNEDIKAFFLKELYSIKKFTQHNDSEDFFDPEQEYGDHIMKCQQKKDDLILETIKANVIENKLDLMENEITDIFQKKREEIWPLIEKHIEDYIEIIEVTYIDPE